MLRYMLDTNIVSFLIKESQPFLAQRISQKGIERIAISAIVEAELLWGLAKKQPSSLIQQRVMTFLTHVEILAWDRDAAQAYARLKKTIQNDGVNLSTTDMLIAAHAYSLDLTLITNDQAFFKLQPHLDVQDWTV
ncbi:MAG: PIN domain-containing protein [Agitococcus sp.]|jgi:tRNA(fMet)-specific endonuclease VapC|nr:PIN domain-containing protein [Moraxellaceae bacterium]MBP9215970.1 PIN domain-containing protein [Agitococcus sp.]MBK7300164.1 PIN domain-containing protein [Moraxellaceae bacterium]MBK8327604.1 PIN domain-containing protein [Moraxellaceae bacterium]MBK9186679.1 PIN domain-containing protein [Moraxellaceae bacterium]